MKASLQLKMGQQLTMTPQLQQAIRLLQLSSLELQQEIQQALDSNPLLELDEEQSDSDPISNEDRTTSDSDSYSESDSDNEYSTSVDVDPQQDSAAVDTSDALTQDSMPDDLPMDTTWDEVYTVSSNSSSGGMRDDDMPFQGETTEGLYEHLEWQKNLTPFSDNDLAIATAIIDAVDERGYLTQNCEDILEAMGDPEIEIDEVEAVLKRVQHFDPIGVAARDLSECLLIQLAQYTEATPI